MKIEYDSDRDLLYVWFGKVGAKAALTVTVSPGVHADFDARGKLIGLEVLDATEILGGRVQFEIALPAPEAVGTASVEPPMHGDRRAHTQRIIEKLKERCGAAEETRVPHSGDDGIGPLRRPLQQPLLHRDRAHHAAQLSPGRPVCAPGRGVLRELPEVRNFELRIAD